MNTNLIPLKVFGTGQITLPKKFRDKYNSAYYVAEETNEGILIRPLIKTMYYEKSEEEFGLNFPVGISAGNLLNNLKKADERLSKIHAKTTKKP